MIGFKRLGGGKKIQTKKKKGLRGPNKCVPEAVKN